MGTATEYLFCSQSDFRDATPRDGGVVFRLVMAPAEEPLTVEEAKANLRIRAENARHDALITRIIPQARQWIELATSQLFISQTWKQIHTATGSLLGAGGTMPQIIPLHLEEVISVTSVEYFPTLDSTSMTTVDATTYFLTGQSVVPRTTWPSTRGIGGMEITYVAGHAADRDALLTSSHAMPMVRALDMVVAYLFENPGDMTSFESGGGGRTRIRSLPPEALDMLATYERFVL